MNKRISSLITAALMVALMMAFASCKKDSDGSGGGDDPEPTENPFLGTWVHEEDANLIVVVATTTWTVKYGTDLIAEGTYTPRIGDAAALKVTKVGEGSDFEVEDNGTATISISGKKLLVEFYGEIKVFVKEGGPEPENPFVGTWVHEEDENVVLEVKAAKWAVNYDDDFFCIGTYTYKGNTAQMTVTEAEEWSGLEVGDKGTATISGKKLLVEFYGEVEVFVKKGSNPPPPPGDIYREPYTKWGSGLAAVKQYEIRKLVDEDDDYLEYDGENKDVAAVAYFLDDNDNLLHHAIVLFNNTSNIEKRALDFLKEIHNYQGKDDDGNDYFIFSDGKTRVYLYYHSQIGGWIADYYDADYYVFDKSPLPAKSFRETIQTGLLR